MISVAGSAAQRVIEWLRPGTLDKTISRQEWNIWESQLGCLCDHQKARMRINLALLLSLSLPVIKAQAAAFQNLDFDSANTSNLIPRVPPGNPPFQNVGSGSPADLIPGWLVLLGTDPYSNLYWLNLNSVGGALVSIYDRNNFLYVPSVHVPVQGAFSFALWPSSVGPPLSLIQVGDVPAGAQSIHFTSFGAGVQLFVNESLVPLIYTYGPPGISPDTRAASVEGDVSAYAGQTMELKFTSLPILGTGANLNGLDGIYFSPVPEPKAWVLFGVGVFSFGIIRRSRVKNRNYLIE